MSIIKFPGIHIILKNIFTSRLKYGIMFLREKTLRKINTKEAY